MLPVAIYTNKLLTIDFINQIKCIINQSDICIFTDDIHAATNYHTAMLPSIYMEFHKGIIIFIDINDYWSYKERLLSKDIYLFIDNLESIVNDIDRETLKDFKNILTLSDNQIKMVQL